MPATMTTVSNILKDVYEPRVREQLENNVVALKRIEKTSEGVTQNLGGNYVTFAVHTRRNNGIGARKEMELLPSAGNQGGAAATVKLHHLYGAAQLTGQTFELANTNVQAFTSALDQEMTGLSKDLAKDMNRQIFGDGRGTIGVVTSVVTSTTIPVDRADLFNEGDRIDIVTAPATVAVSDRTVDSIDVAGKTITISGAAVTTVVGQLITRLGSGPAALNDNREVTGLDAIISDTGTIYGIDPTVEAVWKSEVNDNGGTNRALSESLMITMVDNITAKGGNVSVIFQNLGVRRAYFNLLVSQRQFSNVKTFTGGFSGLVFTTDRGEIPVVVDNDAPPNTQYYVDESELTYYRTHDWQFMDRDGSKWERVTGYDAYKATMFQYAEFATHRRNAHGKLEDITEA